MAQIQCIFCDHDIESTTHLLFKCDFGKQILQDICCWLGARIPESDCLGKLTKIRGSTVRKQATSAAVAACIYYFRIKRCGHVFGGRIRQIEVII